MLLHEMPGRKDVRELAAGAGRWAGAGIHARDVIALHATVLVEMRESGITPSSWRGRRFERAVEAVRVHLGLLTDRGLLVDSFRRESAYLLRTRYLSVADAEHVLATSAVDVAYAIRWLELDGPAPAPSVDRRARRSVAGGAGPDARSGPRAVRLADA
jgi:hypothetical protein